MRLRQHVLSLGTIMGVGLICATAAAHADQHAFDNAHGIVMGDGYYQSAVVCLDLNNNAHCDDREPATRTDASGYFSLRGNGSVIAEIVPGKTKLYNPHSGKTSTATEALTFRAAQWDNAVVSALSTEALAQM